MSPNRVRLQQVPLQALKLALQQVPLQQVPLQALKLAFQQVPLQQVPLQALKVALQQVPLVVLHQVPLLRFQQRKVREILFNTL